MRRLLVLLVVPLLLAACGGGDDDSDAAKARSTTTTVAGTAADGSSTTVAGAGGGVAAGSTPKGGSSGAAAGATTAPTQPPPAAPPGATFTAPGKYTYKITGTANGRPVDFTSTLTVDAPNGADQHSSQTTPMGTTDQVLRAQADGVYLVSLKIGAGLFTKEFRPNPPGLTFPAPPTVGRAWSWEAKSTDGKTTVNSAFKVLRRETVDVAGQKVDAVVVEAEVKVSGDINATSKQTLWVSEAHRLVVRTDEKGTGPTGASETSAKLQSTRPA